MKNYKIEMWFAVGLIVFCVWVFQFARAVEKAEIIENCNDNRWATDYCSELLEGY